MERSERMEKRFLAEAARGSRVWRFRSRQALAFTLLFALAAAYQGYRVWSSQTVTATLLDSVGVLAACLAATVTAATWLHSGIMEGAAIHLEKARQPPG